MFSTDAILTTEIISILNYHILEVSEEKCETAAQNVCTKVFSNLTKPDTMTQNYSFKIYNVNFRNLLYPVNSLCDFHSLE